MKREIAKVQRDFIANLDIRDKSKSLYNSVLNIYIRWVVYTGRDIKSLKRADVIEYKAFLLRSNKSECTIDLYLTVVRRFYEYTELTNEHENIAAGIRLRHKHDGYKKEHLSVDEIYSLFSVIDTNTIRGMRDFAIINLMLRSGMRCVEVSRLRVCDIYVSKEKCWVMLQRKGNNSRTEKVGLTLKTIDPIMKYIDYKGVADEKSAVFTTNCNIGEIPLSASRIGKIVRGYMIKAGVHSSTKTTHSLRHTAAVQAILNKVPIKEVQVMLGHKRIETTELYLKSVEEELRLRNPATHALDDVF